jgi:addiction module HigA family antidote
MDGSQATAPASAGEGLAPVHPGEILKADVVPELQRQGVTKIRLAELLGMSRQNLDNLLNGTQAMTPKIALRLGRILGNDGARFWMDLQVAYDLALARAELAGEIEQLPVIYQGSLEGEPS